MLDLADRKAIARYLIESGSGREDALAGVVPAPAPVLAADLQIPFPDSAPQPTAIEPAPSPFDALPQADVIVITWTRAEVDALADVLTPGVPRSEWHDYKRDFEERYRPMIRQGAPASRAGRLGSYYLTKVAAKRVLCFKSELHLNQDGIRTAPGRATLPVKDLFVQLITETGARHVLTIGTAGATIAEHDLGDVLVTRAALFRLKDEFFDEPFNDRLFKSDWQVPTSRLDDAETLMRRFADRLVEPKFGPPTVRFGTDELLTSTPANTPTIHLDGRDLPDFFPMLTADSFEFGTSTNGLDQIGCAVEMGDAVLGLACEELDDPPDWLILRNVSDPQINGRLPTQPRALDMQAHWAVWYYEVYGYWTSVTGALATWGVIAGLED